MMPSPCRLFPNLWVRLCLFLFVCVIASPCAEAVVLGVDENVHLDHFDASSVCEFGGSVYEPHPIALLDIWAGASAFTNAFGKQSLVQVMEHAWIEWDAAAIMFLPSLKSHSRCQACLELLLSCVGALEVRLRLNHYSRPQLLSLQCSW